MDDELSEKVPHFVDILTRVGGEVSRLRAEMDGLLEQNNHLLLSIELLKEVIAEKGVIDLEDFDLACEVMEMRTERAKKRRLNNFQQ